MKQPSRQRSDASSREAPVPGQESGADADIVRVGLVAFGLYLVALSLLMIAAPGFFFHHVAPIGVRNDHYIRDGATFQLALGAGALVAAHRPDWRLPVLMMLTLQFVLHAINHLNDIGGANPRWLGVANFVALAASAALLGWLLSRESARTNGQPQ